jgi:L-threonylcarbamoyladenylate synthase
MTPTKRTTKVLTPQTPDERRDAVEEVAAVMRRGGVAAIPTDTVWGLVCRYDSLEGKKQIQQAKSQDDDKPFQMLIGAAGQVEMFCDYCSRIFKKFMKAFWPGALTIIVPSSDGSTIGFRLPERQDVRNIIHESGYPLAATSANIHGHPPLNTVDDIREAFEGEIDIILDVPFTLSSNLSSTVVKIDGDVFQILREGEISSKRLEETANSLILFLCSDHSCRSAMAAVVMKQLMGEDGYTFDFHAASFGLSDKYIDVPAGIQKALADNGYTGNINRISPFSISDIDKADYIFVFSEDTKDGILDISPELKDNIYVIRMNRDEFPKQPETGFNIGPGYREEVINIERSLWQLKKKISPEK